MIKLQVKQNKAKPYFTANRSIQTKGKLMSKQASNFLFIFSDQHTRRPLGCLGHPLIKTPHLDRLAERGTLFRQAYCNGPICVPSRGSLATGRFVHDLAVWDNCTPYYGQQPSWGHRLMEQGHKVVSIGKLHYRDTADPNGFEEEIVPMHIIEGVGMLFTICRNPLPVSKKFAWLVENAGAGDSTYLQYDHDITTRAIAWLKEEAPKHTEKPWVLFVSLVCPHPPWVAPEQFYQMYPLADIHLPLAYRLEERPMHSGLEDYRHFFGVQGTFDEATLRKVTAAYYGMISYLDDNIGKLLTALEASGLAQNTTVLYASDHGESMGEKGMFSKCNMYEESVGIPMILAGPGLPFGKEVDTPVQLLDVFPTILETTGVSPKDEDQELPGTSLVALAEGDQPERVILSEQHSAGAKSAVFMIRKGDWKYVHYVEGYQPQLFNLANDPLELTDLAELPEHATNLADCEGALRNLLNPEEVDQQAKADQAKKLAQGGGVEAIVAKGSPGYTPVPGEAPDYM